MNGKRNFFGKIQLIHKRSRFWGRHYDVLLWLKGSKLNPTGQIGWRKRNTPAFGAERGRGGMGRRGEEGVWDTGSRSGWWPGAASARWRIRRAAGKGEGPILFPPPQPGRRLPWCGECAAGVARGRKKAGSYCGMKRRRFPVRRPVRHSPAR